MNDKIKHRCIFTYCRFIFRKSEIEQPQLTAEFDTLKEYFGGQSMFYIEHPDFADKYMIVHFIKDGYLTHEYIQPIISAIFPMLHIMCMVHEIPGSSEMSDVIAIAALEAIQKKY